MSILNTLAFCCCTKDANGGTDFGSQSYPEFLLSVFIGRRIDLCRSQQNLKSNWLKCYFVVIGHFELPSFSETDA